METGDLEGAECELGAALAIAKSKESLSALILFQSYLAVVKFRQGRLEESLAIMAEAISKASSNVSSEESDSLKLHCLLLRAEILRDSGNGERAVLEFLDALELAVHCDDCAAAELSCANLGRLYLHRGWAEQATVCFRQALEMRDETRDKAALLGSLGLCMTELGDFDRAIGFFRTAYLEAEFQEDIQTMAVCCGSEGNTLFELKSYMRALECYEKALELSRAAGDGRREGIWTGNIGTTWLKLGDTDKAMEYCRRAVEIAGKYEDMQSEAAHIDSLGDCYATRGDLEEAFEHYRKALELGEQCSDRLGQRIYLTNMGRVFERMGQMLPAFEYLGRAVDLFDNQRAYIKADDLKTSFANRGGDLYKDIVRVALALGKRVEALEYVGKAKSRALLDLLSNSPIDLAQLQENQDEGLKKLILKERALRSQIDHLERVFWQGTGNSDSGHRGSASTHGDAQGLYRSWREVVGQLKQCHPNYATMVSTSTLSYDEILHLWQPGVSTLGRDTAIIEFFWTDDFLLAVSIGAWQHEPLTHVITDRENLDSLEEDLATFLEMSSTEGWEVPVSLCRRLYEKLLQPLLESVPDNVERLLVIPHGSLFHLPFAALHNGQSYLCQKFAFSYLPSISLIPVLSGVSPRSSNTDSASYLISAISDYSATRRDGLVFSSTLRSSAGLDDLSYTEEEARSILAVGEKMDREMRLITNEEVKTELARLFSEFPVVHFAGHAIFNPDEPMASGLVLSDGTVLTAASILERSSLRTNCGKLLVLSACQTGVNLVTAGGEILGLARALMYAGMPNLVLSLWEVADRSTSDLMHDFHAVWQGGKLTISEALRQAQCRSIKQGQPIHAWAPFIHFGID